MKKIVILNSGGFDSICLIYHLVNTKCESLIEDEDVEIHSLHFSYGEKNEYNQTKCVEKVCKKFGLIDKRIILPNFNWTRSNFYDINNKENTYLEYRNLIFLSFAISYAESIGAEEIYMALLMQTYKDCSPLFITNMNYLIEESGITIKTPFIEHHKEFLRYIATYYSIEKDEYFSCDNPNHGKPCGICKDCLELKELDLM